MEPEINLGLSETVEAITKCKIEAKCGLARGNPQCLGI